MAKLTDLPEKAEVVIIGGGIIGCSIAYHLTKRGMKDVVLLERKQLTCGTTWHAAGLVSMLWPTPTLTELAKYSHELYARLEEETGQATGYKQIGSLSIARTAERLEELKRLASVEAVFGVEAEMISLGRLEELYPGINPDGILGAMYIRQDGQTNPVDTTMALAKGARMGGAAIYENTKAEELCIENGAIVGVHTDRGFLKSSTVILCGGMWSREIAKSVGVELPLHACEHFYVVTEEMDGLTPRPVLRDFDKGVYFKEDAGKMLVGWFEHNAKGLSMDRISEDFCFDQFPCDMEHIEEYLIRGMETFPKFGEVGIRTWFNGPESFTSDNLHLMGPTPEVDNLYVACGLNSKGIGAGGGLGKLMADWVVDGYPSGDISECDVTRHHPCQRTDQYVAERIPEALGHTYAMHWPYYQYHSARNLQQSPLHEVLKDQGACFGEVGGFERPNWFAKPGQKAEYIYSYRRQNWFANTASEHMAVRETVGLYDISSFGKFEVSGKDALTTLQILSAANIDVPVGKVVYTQWLNQRGGIEADLTICRVASDKFWVVTSIGSFNRDWWHLKKHAQGDTKVENISAAYACMALQGPLSRQLLESVTDIDLSFDAFPFGTGRHANIGGHLCWLQRISYVGELGWEIMVPADNAEKLYTTLYQAGKSFSLQNVGLHAVNSLRLEKGFRHWGHDIGSHDNLLEAGLNFVADMTSGDFIGYQALMTQRSKGVPERRLVQFRLENPDPLLYHNEPIVMNGEIVGYLTSGAFGHAIGSSIGMGYVNVPLLSNEIISAAEFEIEIALERFSAQASLRGWYDPKGLKMRQ